VTTPAQDTLIWHPDAIGDLVRLAQTLQVEDIKSVQDNVLYLARTPRPINRRPLPGIADGWRVPMGEVWVHQITDRVIFILGLREPDEPQQ
jgi:hypothetical protein